MKITPTQTEEEKELANLKAKLVMLDLEFGDVQLQYNTLTNEISLFRNRYHLRVGFLYAQLDRIDAEVREYLAKLEPENEDFFADAVEARRKANETEEEANSADEEKPAKFTPTESLKKLFRKIASKIHPDKSKNADDKNRRNNFMAQLNSAYEICDEEMMNEILARHELDGEILDTDLLTIQLRKAEESLAEIIKKIAYMRDAIGSLKNSTWMKLKTDTEDGEKSGVDVLGELAEKIYEKITEKQKDLNELKELNEDVLIEVEENIEDGANTKTSGTHEAGEDSNPFMSEYLIHRTMRGEKVRGKSEMIIANIIFGMQLDYRYEYPIEGSVTFGVRRPNFIFFKKDRSIIIWEHLGMLDDEKYASKWEKKLEWYVTNGWVEGETLFLTKDKHHEGFDSQRVYKIAKIIEKLVNS